MATLGRVTDPKALDADAGPRARLEVKVLPAWLTEGAEIEIATPRLLVCDRCGGGGCDGCARSGALRGPSEARARCLRVRLAPSDGEAVRLRIPAPFEEKADIGQLIVAVVPSDEPSEGVTRCGAPPAPPSTKLWWMAAFAAAAAAAWLFW